MNNKKPTNTNLPKGWEIKKLGEVCEVISGQSPESRFYNDKGKGLPFYQGKKEFTDKFIDKPTKWTTKITKKAKENDILMSVRAPVGPVNFATQKICIGRGLAAIRCGKLVDKEFMFNFLKKYEKEITGNAGAVFNSINKKQIEQIPIPIPPLPEQKRIVAILDRAFEEIDQAKANAEQNLKNAKELFESYLNRIFENGKRKVKTGEWEEKKLGEVCEVINGGTPKTNIKKYWDGDINWITPKDMGKLTSKYVKNTPRKITTLGLKKSSAKLLPIHSIILSTRAPIGHLAINTVEMATNQGCRGIVPNRQIITEYIFYFLKKSVEELNKLGTGATFKELSSRTLSNIIIPLPPIKTQKQIVKKLDKLQFETRKLEEIYKKKINNLEELRKSILEKAFNGELTKKEVNL